MTVKTDAQLTADANVIFNETTPGANTAQRVGQMSLDIIDSKLNSQTTVGTFNQIRGKDVSGAYATSTEFVGCRVVGALTVTGTATFRDARASGAFLITATAIETDRASAYALQNAGCTVSVLPTDLEPSDPLYGWGTSGNLSSSSGSTGLVENYYNNVTLTGTAQILTDRFVLRVKNLLDLSSAGAAAITGATQANGGNAAGATAGAASASPGNANGHFAGVPGAVAGVAGATGTTGAGAAATALGTFRYTWGSNGGAAGASGAGTNAGVALQAAATITFPRVSFDSYPLRLTGPAESWNTAGTTPSAPNMHLWGSLPGRPGSSGGGSGTLAGGGGGGSAQGSSPIIVYARGIKRGVGTAAGVIAGQVNAGGKGGNGAGTNTGGGSGAGGTGGAGILIIYDWLIGTQVAGACVANGGAGGDGGDGGTGGAGGDGGTGGDGGRITLLNRITGVVTQVQGSAGTAGGIHSGVAHGTGGAGGTCSTAL